MIIGFASADRFPGHQMSDGLEKWGGSGWARIGQYLEPLSEVLDVVVGGMFFYDGAFHIHTDDGGREVCPDAIVIQRYMHDTLANHIYEARSNGQYVINDVDDWYWGLDTKNRAYQSTHPKFNSRENINHYRKIIGASDLVLVSTPFLLEKIGPLNDHVELFPNYVDVQRFTQRVHNESTVPVVGWAGSTGHRSGDLETMRGILAPMAERGEIQLQHSGHVEGQDTFASVIGAPEASVIRLPLVEARLYPSILTMDVGIAPLRDTPFNHAKSEIKAMEYSAAGIPWVATPLSAYAALHEELGIGRLAKKPVHWINHLRALKDPELRHEEGTLCRKRIQDRDISIGVQLWTRLLNSIG